METSEYSNEKIIKYKIAYRGILRYGDVKVGFCGKNGPTKEQPTYFRFKFVAAIVAFIFNKDDKGFKTYTVVPVWGPK